MEVDSTYVCSAKEKKNITKQQCLHRPYCEQFHGGTIFYIATQKTDCLLINERLANQTSLNYSSAEEDVMIGYIPFFFHLMCAVCVKKIVAS